MTFRTENNILKQDKLDVVNKGRSNIFNWKGQFTPEFVEYILNEYGSSHCLVADPFSGSGTVMSECLAKGYSCVGFELNPSAYYMSKFFEYGKLTMQERQEVVSKCNDIILQGFGKFTNTAPVFEEADSYRVSYSNLLSLASFFSIVTPEPLIPILINVLFLCEKDKKLTLKESVRKRFDYLCGVLFTLPETQGCIKAYNLDARTIGNLYDGQIDLILTSPPYINVFNYHQNFRAIVERFGYDILNVANSEIGANRKFRSNRFKTVVQYAMDMGDVLSSCSQATKEGGKIIFVVGRESMVRKTPFYNSLILGDLINEFNSLQLESVMERTFKNRYGENIKEDILVVGKVPGHDNCDESTFYNVGINNIKKALAYAPSDAKNGLLEIINEKGTIKESPIYYQYETVHA